MEMKKLAFITIILLAAFTSCTKPENDQELVTFVNSAAIDEMAYVSMAKSEVLTEDDFPAEEILCNLKEYKFTAGQHIDAGNVLVGNDDEFLYIKITSTDGFQNVAENVKLWIGTSIFESRPSAGHFPFKYDVAGGETTLCLSFELSELQLKCDAPEFYIAVHGDVFASEGDEEPSGETAWGGDNPGDGNAWWFYIAYEPECCEIPECDLSVLYVVTDIKCFEGNTGKIDLTITGGEAPFTILWSNDAITEDLDNIPAGTYSVTIYDANQCSYEITGIVVEEIPGLEIKGKMTPVSCKGNDGAIDIEVTGGTAPYIFSWSPNGETTEDLTGLNMGDYSVIVYDANRCMASAKFTVTEDCEKPEGIIAFARKTYEPMVHCFLDLDLDETMGPDFEQWGWTNGAMYPDETFLSTYVLWINLTDCDVSKAVKVGEIKLHYYAGTATATITLSGGYTMNESRLYIGNDILPKDGNNWTVDPAYYPYKHTGLGAVDADSYIINGLSGNIYIIGYVVLNHDVD